MGAFHFIPILMNKVWRMVIVVFHLCFIVLIRASTVAFEINPTGKSDCIVFV